jgi:serine/threonine protein kinase
MALRPGTPIGPYRIDEPLGAGGMGEVYRATDTRLGRDVAIKIVSAGLADAGRLARFEREARMLAALNHPHIATLFAWEPLDPSLGEAGGTMLVMELVDGPTLEMKLARGALPLPEVVRIGSQIADAVAAAHDHGIVHRDLKPANIKLTATGAVKVLDFGIAKAVDAAQAAAATATLTEAGQIVGTSAYMSPEQTRGSDIDARADVWAFGCVLFEMLTGQRAFGGATGSDVSAAVLEREPNWVIVPANTPPAMPFLLRRSLQKEPRERLRSMIDVRMILADLGGLSASGARRGAHQSRGPLLGATVGGAAVLAALSTWALMRPQDTPSEPTQRYEIVTPVTSPINVVTTTPAMSLSPDGRQISFVTDAAGGSGGQLMIRAIDDLVPRRIEGAPRVRDHAFLLTVSGWSISCHRPVVAWRKFRLPAAPR